MKEYPITPVYKVIGLLLAAAMILGGILFIKRAFDFDSPNQVYPLLIVGGLFVLIGAWLLIGVTRLCVTVDDDMVRVNGALGKRELPISEIDGYRSGDKNRFFLVQKNGKGFVIPDYINERDELIQWIKSRYGDVDARQREAETKLLLEDERYGTTEEDRRLALRNARIISWTGSAVGFALFFLLLFAQDYRPIQFLALAAPWAAIFLTWRSKGLIRLSMVKSSPYPSLLFLILFPVGVVAMYPLRFHLYGFSAHAWFFTLLVALAVMLVAATALRDTIALEKRKVVVLVCLVVFATGYGFGVLVSTNCLFDQGAPQTLNTRVVGKHVNHGKSTSYSLELSPWGKYTTGTTVTVSRDFFYRVREYDIILIWLYPGRWGIPWYQVVKPEAQ
jgi:hypothetical protein